MTKTMAAAIFGTALILGGAPASAQTDAEIRLLRKDLKSEKKQIIASNLQLTDSEAERFWTVYDRFADELSTIYDRRVALLKDYLGSYESLTDEQAESYLKERVATEEAGLQLRNKYIPMFRKVLSGKSTALFFQLEWRVNLLIETQLAAGVPLIEP